VIIFPGTSSARQGVGLVQLWEEKRDRGLYIRGHVVDHPFQDGAVGALAEEVVRRLQLDPRTVDDLLETVPAAPVREVEDGDVFAHDDQFTAENSSINESIFI
jgi:hypothetical protein